MSVAGPKTKYNLNCKPTCIPHTNYGSDEDRWAQLLPSYLTLKIWKWIINVVPLGIEFRELLIIKNKSYDRIS